MNGAGTPLIELPDARTIAEVINRAGSLGYDLWWSRMSATGYCAAPITLHRKDQATASSVLVRCKNRRAAVCPSCSDLYAGDTWHLVHAGLGGGHEIPVSVAEHPAVFATLTAPSYGPVHTTHTGSGSDSELSGAPCRPAAGPGACPHGVARSCAVVHSGEDSRLGQPICPECYDYTGHAQFTWNAPTLWARFTITLRRLVRRELAARGEEPGSVRVSFVKIVEMQRRGIPHFHSVIRLDATPATGDDHGPRIPDTTLTADLLASLVRRAAARVRLEVPSVAGELTEVRFGTQIDVQLLTIPAEPRGIGGGSAGRAAAGVARRIAGYLAKYVTKSVTDFGIAPRRFSPEAIDSLDVSPHVALLLHALTRLSTLAERTGEDAGAARWLHTLGYRGHITTKSRRYSTTMGALRAIRAQFQKLHATAPATTTSQASNSTARPDGQENPEWEFAAHGLRSLGEHFLVISAAIRAREARWVARQLVDAPDRGTP